MARVLNLYSTAGALARRRKEESSRARFFLCRFSAFLHLPPLSDRFAPLHARDSETPRQPLNPGFIRGQRLGQQASCGTGIGSMSAASAESERRGLIAGMCLMATG